MSAISFTNPGVIDPRSITTFGVSVKETENPIGFFGTGLKYAIAVLLRSGCAVVMHAGLQRIEFSLQRDTLRGKEFDFVQMTVDGGPPQALGFTTELGKQWALWMAYREIACNCTDEKGSIFEGEAPVSSDTTTVTVRGDAFADVYRQRAKFILQDKPALVVDGVEIRRQPGVGFFYRGVRVHEWGMQARLTYNCTNSLELTEDRTLKSEWMAKVHIARALLKCTDTALLQSILTAKDEEFEGRLDFHGWSVEPSEQFLDAVEACITDKLGTINQTAMRVYKESARGRVQPNAVRLSRVQQAALSKAQDFCESIGFPVRSYPLIVAESLGPDVLGLAENSTIYLASRVFDQGVKQIASTLIEEYVHLKHGLKDCTRGLQTFLFDRVVSMGEELQGEPL